ncbi:hypothetical protein SBRY_20130 [Actinacidiphila bryophytorum]|uniref:Uncharacterized protein n=1 Tax=Actinacidiphila bryophytorum TaxID=1436133 RepID=A0A9W4GZ57_9ACTN|nr:hypothetical protein SBRY_20130 [Actinacidiphila bryophytorum]
MDLEHLGLLLRAFADLLLRRHRDELRPRPEEPPGVAWLTRRHPENGGGPVHGWRARARPSFVIWRLSRG